MKLKNKAYSAIRWTTGGAAVSLLIQFVQLVVLARLLTPADFGLVATLNVLVSLCKVLSDLGVNSAYLQSKTATTSERSSLFWLNLVASAFLFVILIFTSPFFANWFGHEVLENLIIITSSTLVISALGQQIRIDAQKQLNFRPLILCEVTSAIIGLLVSVAAAVAGHGVYAIVAGTVVSSLLGTILAWIFLSNGWRPLFHFNVSDTTRFLKFGGSLILNNFINEINRGLDIIIGGRTLETSTLGVYSLSKRIVLQVQGLINPIVTRVGFPLIAIIQNEPERVQNIFYRTLNFTASTNAAIYTFIFMFAEEVSQLILGPDWPMSATLIQVLSIWGFFRSTGNPTGSLLLGLGRADLSLKWNLGILLILPLVLWHGSSFGAMGLSTTMTCFAMLLFIPSWHFLVRPLCGMSLSKYLIATLRPLVLSIASISVGRVAASIAETVYFSLFIGVSISVPLYLVMSMKFNADWVDALKQLVRR